MQIILWKCDMKAWGFWKLEKPILMEESETLTHHDL